MVTFSPDAPAAAPLSGPLAYAAPVARVMLALVFILGGWGKLSDPAGTAGYISSGGLPGGLLVWPVIALELVGGLLVALGLFARPAALALAAFTLLAGILYHLVPGLGMEGFDRFMQMIHVQKNLAISGGLLLLAVFGPGAYALALPRR